MSIFSAFFGSPISCFIRHLPHSTRKKRGFCRIKNLLWVLWRLLSCTANVADRLDSLERLLLQWSHHSCSSSCILWGQRGILWTFMGSIPSFQTKSKCRPSMRWRRNTNRCCCPLQGPWFHRAQRWSLVLFSIWAFVWVFPDIGAEDSQNKSNPLLTAISVHTWSSSLYGLEPASCILLFLIFPPSSSLYSENFLDFTSCSAIQRWTTCTLHNTNLPFPQCWQYSNTSSAKTPPPIFANHPDRPAYARSKRVVPL